MMMAQMYENKINHLLRRGISATTEPSGGTPGGPLEVEIRVGPGTFPRQGDEEGAKRRRHHTHGCAMGRIVDRQPALERS